MNGYSWTPALDAAIIAGRSMKDSFVQIALQLEIHKDAVRNRWNYLKDTNRVPDDVMDALRCVHKPKPPFSQADDEAIVREYMSGVDRDKIQEVLRLEGRSPNEVRDRCFKLEKERPPVWENAMMRAMIKGEGKKNNYAWKL
ncbi:hypothetical protein Ptr902_05715 [Pyrenophora tritici-repentis]|nr:hypothetical protein Ptr902_05715 [Pyrenophora tritici-repentis]